MGVTSLALAAVATAATNMVLPDFVTTRVNPENPRTEDTAQSRQHQEIANRVSADGRRAAALTARFASSWINIRSGPTTRSSVLHEGRPGDQVEVLDQAPGRDDSYTWYWVRFRDIGVDGWVREDLVALYPSTPGWGDRPGAGNNALPPPDAPVAIDSLPPEPPPIERRTDLQEPIAPVEPAIDTEDRYISPGSYSAEQINYFLEVALGSEFGGASQRIRKWRDDIYIRVNGTPTSEDRQTLNGIVSDLNRILDQSDPNSLNVTVLPPGDRRQANIDIHFAPHTQFRQIEPNYQPGNLGFAWVRWQNDEIYTSRILISTIDVNQRERSHLIREELTQSLGLLRDSYRYPDSIFYQGWTETNAYSVMDEAVISLLYRSDIEPGMDNNRVRRQLSTTVASDNRRSSRPRSNFWKNLGDRFGF
ncbi:MAG: DUF2927 domain-containing protein [Elainellaceae cyanobacterium]